MIFLPLHHDIRSSETVQTLRLTSWLQEAVSYKMKTDNINRLVRDPCFIELQFGKKIIVIVLFYNFYLYQLPRFENFETNWNCYTLRISSSYYITKYVKFLRGNFPS